MTKLHDLFHRRDPSENLYFTGYFLLQKSNFNFKHLFSSDLNVNNENNIIKIISDISIGLQQKQKISMSVSLLQRLSFDLYLKGKYQLAKQKLLECLECHFRQVYVHQKINELLSNETEESFYSKHSWSGCISIFVISSLAASLCEPEISIPLCNLAAFSIHSLFSSSSYNPKKQTDYITFEPTEILPSIEIFSSMDSNQPYLEPISPNIILIAIENLLPSMSSYGLYFELFKPLSFARHFYRFIIRDKKYLARSRLMTSINCCKFGLIHQSFLILNDVITNFGSPRVTKEVSLYSNKFQRITYDQTESPSLPSNLESLKQISSPSILSTISNFYGSSITSQYTIAISHLLLAICSSIDPMSDAIEISPSRNQVQSSRSKHRKSHNKKEMETAISNSNSSTLEISDFCLKLIESLLTEQLSKDSKHIHSDLKYEMNLILAEAKMNMWQWDLAIKISLEIKQSLISNPISSNLNDIKFFEHSLQTNKGLISQLNRILFTSYFNSNDLQSALLYCNTYQRSLIHIQNNEFNEASKLLSQIILKKPQSIFSKEYIYSVGQYLMLYCFQKSSIDNLFNDYNNQQKELLNPILLSKNIKTQIWDFYVEQLNLKSIKNLYLRNTPIIIRLFYIEALVKERNQQYQESLLLLNQAQSIMNQYCPFVLNSFNLIISINSYKLQIK